MKSRFYAIGGNGGRPLWREQPIAPEVFVPFFPTGPVLVPVLGPGVEMFIFWTHCAALALLSFRNLFLNVLLLAMLPKDAILP